MRGSNEKVGNTTVGKVFTRLSELADGNTQIQSQLMSFAYALAGSRETGKLTDKDVAAALVTFGGGDISEGKWFASGETLITGINQALTTATNDYAIRYNKVHQSPGNVKYLKDVEGLKDDDLTDRTTFDVNRFLKNNEGIRSGLSDRIIYDPTGANGQIIRMQSLDKYRGDGAGNVAGTGGLSADALAANTVLNAAAARTRLDPSDPNYLSAAGLQAIMDALPQSVKDELREAGGL